MSRETIHFAQQPILLMTPCIVIKMFNLNIHCILNLFIYNFNMIKELNSQYLLIIISLKLIFLHNISMIFNI